MKYKVGQKLYKVNQKTHEVDEVEITDILYMTSKSVAMNRKTYTEEQLDSLVEDNIISLDKNIIKQQAIKRLEEQFDIKLKEV